MKTLYFLVSLLSVSAQASTLLTRTSSNGSVEPTHARVTTCTISEADVQIGTRGPLLDFPYTMHKQMVFTSEIPNLAVLQSLIEDAALTQPTKTPFKPIVCGGGVIQVEANLANGSQISLITMMGSVVNEENHSASSQKLLKFVSTNCLGNFTVNPDLR